MRSAVGDVTGDGKRRPVFVEDNGDFVYIADTTTHQGQYTSPVPDRLQLRHGRRVQVGDVTGDVKSHLQVIGKGTFTSARP
jgi:hypothetical protein